MTKTMIKMFFIVFLIFLKQINLVLSIGKSIRLDDPSIFPDSSFYAHDPYGSSKAYHARISKPGFHCRNHHGCYLRVNLGMNNFFYLSNKN